MTESARDAEPNEVPTNARKLVERATERGWRVRTTYAQAEVGEQTVESIAVRMHSRWGVLVAVWHGGKFASGLGRAHGDDTLTHAYVLRELRMIVDQAGTR